MTQAFDVKISRNIGGIRNHLVMVDAGWVGFKCTEGNTARNGSLLDASIHHDQTDNINIDRVCLQLEPVAFPTGTFLEDKTFDCIQVGDHLLAMMGDWESCDKVGQASCAPGAIKEKHHVSSHAENNY